MTLFSYSPHNFRVPFPQAKSALIDEDFTVSKQARAGPEAKNMTANDLEQFEASCAFNQHVAPALLGQQRCSRGGNNVHLSIKKLELLVSSKQVDTKVKSNTHEIWMLNTSTPFRLALQPRSRFLCSTHLRPLLCSQKRYSCTPPALVNTPFSRRFLRPCDISLRMTTKRYFVWVFNGYYAH